MACERDFFLKVQGRSEEPRGADGEADRDDVRPAEVGDGAQVSDHADERRGGLETEGGDAQEDGVRKKLRSESLTRWKAEQLCWVVVL